MNAPTEARPWLSLLIPVYNVEAWLRACLASVLSQADAGVEILLLDDVSTDGSAALMQSLAEENPGRLTLLRHQHNSGLSAARNTLLEASRGEYLWFLDSDDELMPGAIADLAAIVQGHAPDLVLCDFRTLRERMKRKHVWRGELHRRSFDGPGDQLLSDRSALLQGLFALGQLHSWSKISRRALWGDDLRFPVGRYYEDMYTTPALALRATSYVYAPRVWVGYRQRGGSILATLTPRKIDDMMQALAGLPARLDAQQPPVGTAARFALANYAGRGFVSAARFMARHADGAALARCLQQFQANSPLSAAALLRAYLARGWLWRASRLHYWLRRAAKAST
ncbi:glycosyltransferase family 2 protein [Paucibacter sp. M5-1]|uniref:glycosyltransferase family 2 protein n=1 Tax=Paucibacter sp. M5-1 TaxID=3015998 RepID=UPI0022B8C58A|nr:glycosyltransferase family 2 protein [Paucibacter sp. M5-1]MCZ7881102.1 glycosyltransferase family 2 protein [Paucibacter sp. M5-1]